MREACSAPAARPAALHCSLHICAQGGLPSALRLHEGTYETRCAQCMGRTGGSGRGVHGVAEARGVQRGGGELLRERGRGARHRCGLEGVRQQEVVHRVALMQHRLERRRHRLLWLEGAAGLTPPCTGAAVIFRRVLWGPALASAVACRGPGRGRSAACMDEMRMWTDRVCAAAGGGWNAAHTQSPDRAETPAEGCRMLPAVTQLLPLRKLHRLKRGQGCIHT